LAWPLTGRTAAQQIGIFTIDFPDPRTIGYPNTKANTLNDSVSFRYRINSNIQTLSTKGADSGANIHGLLYVPDLHTDGCKSEEAKYVPANATRLANLPASENYDLIAVAPWYSAQCMVEYFTAARRNPTTAILVYQLGHDNANPPVLRDASWDLQDGGSWQLANTFPTYALSSTTGGVIMEQMGLYSGNLSSVPNGSELAKVFDDTDYVRLQANVSTNYGAQLPSLWVFLVIVLAILIVAVGITSLAMHLIQRRRRSDLRRRVLEGQVDLEALGVKRLHVSQEVLDKLPTYTYGAGAIGDPEKSTPQLPAHVQGLAPSSTDLETGAKLPALARRSSAPTAPSGAFSSSSQPTCPICLDDFEVNETRVRELPCRHIFHPDCVDTFLLNNSSLCPMCKQTVLPVGECPVTITNLMVRRERHINRMQARGAQTGAAQHSVAVAPPTFRSPVSRAFGSLGSRIGGTIAGRRVFSAPERTRMGPPDIEMAATTDAAQLTDPTAVSHQPESVPPPPALPSSDPDCTPSRNRREWARQRALALLGNRHAPTVVEDESTGPRWRRTLDKVFPGFR
jgi:hypothetical protein